jgi:hypothetical protein
MKVKYVPLEKPIKSYSPFLNNECYIYRYRYNPGTGSSFIMVGLVSVAIFLSFKFISAGIFSVSSLFSQLEESLRSSLIFLGPLGLLLMLFTLWIYIIPVYIFCRLTEYIYLVFNLNKYFKIIKISDTAIEIPQRLFASPQRKVTALIDYDNIVKVRYCTGIFLPHRSHLFNTSHLDICTHNNCHYTIETELMSDTAINNLKFLLEQKNCPIDYEEENFVLTQKHNL